MTSKGTSTGAAQIPLPVNTSATANGAATCTNWANFTAASGIELAIGAQNNTNANIQYVPTTGGIVPAADTDFANNTSITCTATYVSG